jgi:hypothetical protein
VATEDLWFETSQPRAKLLEILSEKLKEERIRGGEPGLRGLEFNTKGITQVTKIVE